VPVTVHPPYPPVRLLCLLGGRQLFVVGAPPGRKAVTMVSWMGAHTGVVHGRGVIISRRSLLVTLPFFSSSPSFPAYLLFESQQVPLFSLV